MSNPEFPATNWLGYSLDMSRTTPMDVGAAAAAVQTMRRIVSYDLYDVRPVAVDGVTYDVPKAIGVAPDVDSNTGSFLTHPTGSDASQAFRADSSLALRYFAVTGDASVAEATEKLFRRNNQYGFFSYSKDKYQAILRDYIDLLNTSSLLSGIRALPTPFNGANADVLQKYKDFFQSYGTHVITKARYGARFQLNVWGANSIAAVNAKWAADINTEFGGIPSGGAFDLTLQDEPQYKQFLEFMQKLISASGGDKALATSIVVDPRSYPVFESWTKTVDMNTSLLGMVTTELWSLLKDSSNDELRKAGPTIQEAFNYIVSHPQPYKTAVTLSIESDWAEFGLLTPSAVITAGSTTPTNTQLTETKITWGKERSHDQKRETINFFVVNDGYPVDFYISHGSDGSVAQKGNARVIMEGNTYVNERITDDNWNTMFFYQAAVTGAPEKSSPNRTDAARPWDDVLEEYLGMIGHQRITEY